VPGASLEDVGRTPDLYAARTARRHILTAAAAGDRSTAVWMRTVRAQCR